MKRYIKSAIIPVIEEDMETKMYIAKNSDNPDTLRELYEWAKNRSGFVTATILSNPNAPQDILSNDSFLSNKELRYVLASNPNTPISMLRKLSEYPDTHARLSQNPSIPEDVMHSMLISANPSARVNLASNPSTPVDMLDKLADNSDHWVRHDVASNPNTPTDVLRKLLHDESDYVLENVMGNPNTTPDMVWEIYNWTDGSIRDMAKYRLQELGEWGK